MNDLTQILNRADGGRASAELLPLVYDELRAGLFREINKACAVA